MNPKSWEPTTGLKGFQEHWMKDLTAGFLVSGIALPLSLGIAAASGFPPVMGVLTAVIGGILVSFFKKSELTIKGPAAGLIVVVAGAVEELGKGDAVLGWHLALGAIVIAGVIQVLMGVFKLPNYADFFPLSAVHGILAAIGLIVIAKQIPLAVGIAPTLLKGKSPLALLEGIPHYLMHMEYHIAIIGLVGLMIMFGWKYLSIGFLKKVPPALVVLIISVVLGRFFHLTEPTYANFKPLISPGDFRFVWSVDFGGAKGELVPVFVKYVAMFALIGSLESLLTVKAIDLIDPFQRKSNLNREVAAIGAGNILAGVIGGLPMISEIVRSSANVNNGARTRWANFFHGVCLLLFVILLSPVIKMIPMAALASMLIYVGFKLASPSEVKNIYHIGKEQLAIFLITIIVALSTDLLVGIASGIVAKIIIQLIYGVKLSHIFAPKIEVTINGDHHFVTVPRSAVFTNYLALKNKLADIPAGKRVQVDFSDAPYVDRTVMENLHRLKNDYEFQGGSMELIGLGQHKALSSHPFAARKNPKVIVTQYQPGADR